MRAVLVTLIVFRHVLPECLLAFFAGEGHLRSLSQPMVLSFAMTLRAIVPLLAAGSADGYLRVQDMFAGI